MLKITQVLLDYEEVQCGITHMPLRQGTQGRCTGQP